MFDETTVRETESAPSSEQLNSANGSHTASPADGQQTQISNSETTALNTEIQETNAPETTTATATPESPAATAPDEFASMDFASALENFEAEQAATEQAAPQEDNVLKGTVVKLTDKHVVVDVGFKSEGMVPLAQVLDREGNSKVKPGDPIEVVIDHSEDEEGYIGLSYEKAQRTRVWDDIERAYNEKTAM